MKKYCTRCKSPRLLRIIAKRADYEYLEFDDYNQKEDAFFNTIICLECGQLQNLNVMYSSSGIGDTPTSFPLQLDELERRDYRRGRLFQDVEGEWSFSEDEKTLFSYYLGSIENECDVPSVYEIVEYQEQFRELCDSANSLNGKFVLPKKGTPLRRIWDIYIDQVATQLYSNII